MSCPHARCLPLIIDLCVLRIREYNLYTVHALGMSFFDDD